MSNFEWVEFNKTWGDLGALIDERGERYLGLLLDVNGDPEDSILIGDVNELGGACLCCNGLSHNTPVLRYRRVDLR